MTSPRHAGLTLIELLVAIAVFAVVSAIMYGSLTQILENRDRVLAEQDFWRAFALSFREIDDDLGQARNRPIRDGYGVTQLAFRGEPVDPRASARASLAFTRAGVPVIGAGARSDFERVGYQLRDGRLLRLTWPVLDRAPQTKPIESVLIDGIEDMRLRFFDGRAWSDHWPPAAQSDPLPRGVEITLTLKHRGSFTRVLAVGR